MARFSQQAVLTFLSVLLMGASINANSQCTECHYSEIDPAIQRLERTVHGSLPGDKDAICTGCHGASDAHMEAPDEISPDISFGPKWKSGPELRSTGCQSCHEKKSHVLWVGSVHQQENLACDDCHNAHQQADLALDSREAEQLCLSCHPRVRSELNLPSRHPISEGKTACTDCHNPHGSLGESGLLQPTVNDNCLSCHQEKRGPFLWEHQPVAEDCTTCHRPHGSVHDRLLTARGPALCQQCHAAAFHPSLPVGSEGLPAGTPNQYLLGKNCLNCHSQIHGSNHPSGARLTR